MQLRQYLAGDAPKAIEDLDHSAAAYTAAKSRLERKYGGKRQQIAMYLEEIEMLPPVRTGNASDLERFADLLDVAVVNLKDAGMEEELQAGSLYTKLQKKLPSKTLAKYHRWIHDKEKKQRVETLLAWVIQEAEFHTIASETVHGLHSRLSSSGNRDIGNREKRPTDRTYLGSSPAGSVGNIKSRPCGLCSGSHRLWACQAFKQMDATHRWAKAKQLGVCYRCLGHGHQGRLCQRSRKCGLDGCLDSHHRLLHDSSKRLIVGLKPTTESAETDTSAASGQQQSGGQEQCSLVTRRR